MCCDLLLLLLFLVWPHGGSVPIGPWARGLLRHWVCVRVRSIGTIRLHSIFFEWVIKWWKLEWFPVPLAKGLIPSILIWILTVYFPLLPTSVKVPFWNVAFVNKPILSLDQFPSLVQDPLWTLWTSTLGFVRSLPLITICLFWFTIKLICCRAKFLS